MSIEGLLAVAGILLAVYAIMRPTQRSSLSLFIPHWLAPSAIGISLIILLLKYGAKSLELEFCPVINLTILLTTVLIPLSAIIFDFILFASAKLTKRVCGNRFQKFLLTSLREDEYDEVYRVISKNKDNLTSSLTPENLGLLFDRRFVRRMMSSLSWIHLELLSDLDLFEKLPNRGGAIDSVMRELLEVVDSPLRKLVISRYGGDEFLSNPTEEEGKLLDSTLLNSEWYCRTNAHYPMLMAVLEKLRSGELDHQYNRNGKLYAVRQGISTRSQCIVFLAIKAHVLAIEAALNKGVLNELDLYVTDLLDGFDEILQRSEYRPAVWDAGYPEIATPFAYLLKEIMHDLEFLAGKAINAASKQKVQGVYTVDPPEFTADRIALCWASCARILAKSEGKVNDRFRLGLISELYIFILKLNGGGKDIMRPRKWPPRETDLEAWRDLFVRYLKEQFRWSNDSGKATFREVFDHLDIGKPYIAGGIDWLKGQLDAESD